MRLFLALCFICLILQGCGSDPHVGTLQNWMSNNGKVKVLSTTAMIDDLVKQVGGDHVDAITLIQGEIDPHSYELVKGDEEKISYAKIIFYNGLGLEHGASLRYQLQKHPHSLGIGDAIQKTRPEEILKDKNQIDPHIWMDISLWAKAIDPIIDMLSSIDPESAAYYRQNGAALYEKMLYKHDELHQMLHKIPAEKRYLVTSHDAFNYFARRYLADENEAGWKERFAAPEGLAPDGQLSSADIQRIIDHLCQYRIGVVFPESNVSRDSLKKITGVCQGKGHKVSISTEVLYGDAMGPPGSDGDSYLKMMQHNVMIILRNINYE